ncbi:TSG6 protein, partial [Amia calva]|nr:TSG6 protein [Amia calva]
MFCFLLPGRVAGVFRYDRGSRYNLTFQQAKTACEKDFGATLADRHQLYAAYEGGLNECRAGWISSAEAAYPRVHKNWKCGQNQTGIITYGIRQNIQETWDVFCYKEDMACGGVLNGLEGEFQSPGFGHSYQSDMDCTWEISAPAGHLILLTFQSFVLEEHRSCKYDSVTVFDGRKAEEQELGRFCGSELPPLLRSTSSSMIVQMKSDSSLQLDGFSAHFRSIKSPSGKLLCSKICFAYQSNLV